MQPDTPNPVTPDMRSASDSAHIPNARSVFDLAWPMALKAMMLHGITIIDAYLVSSLGEEALAAMGLASAITGLVLGFLFAFSSATQIRIAQAFGADDPQRLKSAFYCGLIINLGVALLGLVLIGVSAEAIIQAFAHSPLVAEQALGYVVMFTLVIAFEAVSLCFANHFNGCGKTQLPLIGYAFGMPVNIILSIVLIHGLYGMPAMGLTGAAMGSAVASLLQMLFLGVLFYRANRGYRDVPGWTNGPLSYALKRHLLFSWPIAATFVSVAVSNQVCMLIYAKMSIHEFAAMTLIMPWVVVGGTIGMSWAQAVGILVAQLLGKHQPHAVLDTFLSRAWRMSFAAAGLVAVVYACVCLAAPWIYSELEIATTDALLGLLPLALVLPFPKQSNAICGNTLRASGDTVYVMNIFVGAQWLFKVPMVALFVLYFDLSVFWVFSILILDELVKFPPFHIRTFKGDWKTLREEEPLAT